MAKPINATHLLFFTICAFLLLGDPSPGFHALGQSPQNDAEFKPVNIDDPLPFGQPPISYHNAKTTDVVSRWHKKVTEDGRRPRHDDNLGYLSGLLEELDISPDSQMLVFSKTAANMRQVAPRTPRAIYFNDEAFVAWVPEANSLELCAIDPLKGYLFYILSQDPSLPLQLKREQSCLTCHISSVTLNIPGLMVRSMQVDDRGRPYEGYPLTTHASPYDRRFAGWYVTGTTDNMTHLGNLVGRDQNDRHRDEPTYRGTVAELAEFCDLSAYPSSTSDIVPLLVFHHQSQGYNLILRAGYEARLRLRSDVEEQLFRYLLFLDEPELPGPARGSTEFQSGFEKRGPADDEGRSLRQFDLTKRLFRYRLSYLIYSRAFSQLPTEVKSRIYARISAALDGIDTSVPDDWHTADERAAIRTILDATLPEADWPPR